MIDVTVGGGGTGGSGSFGHRGGNGGSGYAAIYDAGSGSRGSVASKIPVSAFSILDIDAPSGTHNFTVRLGVTDAAAEISAEGLVSLEAYEL